MSWRETRRTMWDTILFNWFGLVRLKHHDELMDKYCRLTAQYIATKERADYYAARLNDRGMMKPDGGIREPSDGNT